MPDSEPTSNNEHSWNSASPEVTAIVPEEPFDPIEVLAESEALGFKYSALEGALESRLRFSRNLAILALAVGLATLSLFFSPARPGVTEWLPAFLVLAAWCLFGAVRQYLQFQSLLFQTAKAARMHNAAGQELVFALAEKAP